MTQRPSARELQRYLLSQPPDDLIADIIALYADYGAVQDFYTLRLRPGYAQELLARHKALITDEFLPAGSVGCGRPAVAQQALHAYERIVTSPEGSAELMIHAVETGASYVAQHGGLDTPLARWLEDTFRSALMLLQEHERLALYQHRCAQIVRAADGVGWGLDEALRDIYGSFFALGEAE